MADPNRVFGGFTTLQGGMNGGLSPSLIAANQYALGVNLTARGGKIKTRPPWANWILVFVDDATEARCVGRFQGGIFYRSDFGENQFLFSRGGRLFKISLGAQNVISEITPRFAIVTTADFTVPLVGAQVTVFVNSEALLTVGTNIIIDSGTYTVDNRSAGQILVTYNGLAANIVAVAGNAVLDSGGSQFIQYDENPSFYSMNFMFLAEKYALVMSGQNNTLIYDGSTVRRAVPGEIPPGVFGIYLWGRIWVTLNDRNSFVAGDLVYSSSGTASENFIDAILKVTENDFLNEGGNFTVPKNAGPISSMDALATQDTSLGIGNLLVGTTSMVFSVNTPVDRTTWKNLTFPIQTISSLDSGPEGPRSVVNVNGDMWYRSKDGIRSFIVATRYLGSWGSTPQSREVQPILDDDTKELLIYGSGMFLNNRLYQTVSPADTENGIVHRGVVSINFDLISSLSNRTSPAWDGLFTGLDILQVLTGRIDEKLRGFAFALNGDALELWEFLEDGTYDLYNTVSGNDYAIQRTPIESQLESRLDDFGDGSQLKKLITAELYVEDLVDNVTLVIKFKPDQSPTWITWTTINLCANVSQCTISPAEQASCSVWSANRRQYAARIMLPRPSEECNPLSGMPVCQGYEFQVRIEGTGHFTINRFKMHAKTISDKMNGECPSNECQTVTQCEDNLFSYNAHG